MKTDREKIVEILKQACRFSCGEEYCKHHHEQCVGRNADHLIANGVTFATDTNVGSKVETNIFDQEEIHHNCTVQILHNSVTGEQSVGWWKEDELPREV